MMKKINGIGIDSHDSHPKTGKINFLHTYYIKIFLIVTLNNSKDLFSECEETPGICSFMITLGSLLIGKYLTDKFSKNTFIFLFVTTFDVFHQTICLNLRKCNVISHINFSNMTTISVRYLL